MTPTAASTRPPIYRPIAKDTQADDSTTIEMRPLNSPDAHDASNAANDAQIAAPRGSNPSTWRDTLVDLTKKVGNAVLPFASGAGVATLVWLANRQTPSKYEVVLVPSGLLSRTGDSARINWTQVLGETGGATEDQGLGIFRKRLDRLTDAQKKEIDSLRQRTLKTLAQDIESSTQFEGDANALSGRISQILDDAAKNMVMMAKNKRPMDTDIGYNIRFNLVQDIATALNGQQFSHSPNWTMKMEQQLESISDDYCNEVLIASRRTTPLPTSVNTLEPSTRDFLKSIIQKVSSCVEVPDYVRMLYGNRTTKKPLSEAEAKAAKEADLCFFELDPSDVPKAKQVLPGLCEEDLDAAIKNMAEHGVVSYPTGQASLASRLVEIFGPKAKDWADLIEFTLHSKAGSALQQYLTHLREVDAKLLQGTA